MSFRQEKRDKIQRYILEKISQKQPAIVKKTAETFGISLNTVYRYLRELEKNTVIEKTEKGFRLVKIENIIPLSRSDCEKIGEDMVYKKYVKHYLCYLPDQVIRIWQYSFMEMMNNAIEHSEGKQVTIYISRDCLATDIIILDDGIGIFKKIKEYYHYTTLDQAINELFKGKLTTDSKNHSGGGIFFTSRILDRFAAVSDGKIFTHDNYNQALNNLEDTGLNLLPQGTGTMIYMGLSNFSNKVLKEVFDLYSDEDGEFTKTSVPVQNIFDDFPVSRSQARRLCHRFENFLEVELDFTGIDEIGQAFAHEIFVVFQNAHKDVRLVPTHMNRDVEQMIHHVKQG